MNKVFNINLGGYPFTIDDKAYQHLSSYLKTIHTHFKNSEGYEEITSDIETRIAELFQESLGHHSIVTHKMVKEAITIMGTPEEFGADPMEEEPITSQSSRQKRKHNYKTGKRLFRDTDDEVIGGVCSGIAAYFGIPDPLWARIFFVLFTISGGIGIPAYIILWAILPEAKNSNDRLAMRGDAINVSNIAKIVEEEVENITDKISEMAENWDYSSSKKKKFGEPNEFRSTVKEGLSFFGKTIHTFIELFSKVIKPIIFIVGFALIIAFTVIWLVSIISFFIGFPFLQFIMPQQPLLGYLGIINLAVFVGVPILSLIFLASKLVFRTRFSVRWKGGLLAFWIFNVISFFGVASYMASQFQTGAEAHQSSQRFSLNEETLTINFTENPYKDSWIQLGPDGMIKLTGDKLVNQTIYLQIEKSEDAEFVLINESKSRGKDLGEAKQLANNIRHSLDLNKNNLNIQPYFLLNKGEKWRAQQVVLTLKVPEGKSIKFKNLSRDKEFMVDYVDENQRHHHLYWAKNGQKYEMSKDGLLGEGKPKSPKSNHDFENKFHDFSKLHIDGDIKIYIEQGEEYSTKLTGKDSYLEKVEIKQFEEVLKVSTNLNTSSPIRLYVTMPSLTELDIENTDDVKISGFKEANMAIYSESRGDIKAYVDVENLTVKLNGRSELDIRGKGKNLTAYLKGRSKLDAERFAINVADVKADDRSSAKLVVSDTLRQRLDKRSNIEVEGSPLILEK